MGPIEELRAKYGTLAEIAPLPSAEYTHPNIVLKLNANSRPVGDTTGHLANRRRYNMGSGIHEWPLMFLPPSGRVWQGHLL